MDSRRCMIVIDITIPYVVCIVTIRHLNLKGFIVKKVLTDYEKFVGTLIFI